MMFAHAREFDSDLAQLRQMRRHLRALLEPRLAVGRPAALLNELELAMHEAASNVILHAYGGHSGHKLRLETELLADRVIVRLRHWGMPFEPGPVRPPRLDGSQVRGYGLFIIDRMVDEARYSTDERGESCVQLTKFLHTLAGNANDARDP